MKRFILWFCFVFAGLLCIHAQNSFWSNTGLVSVKDSAYISIIGDAYNSDSGIYDNSDTIFVTGNWTHNAPNRCFDSIGTGWVYLYADTQHINGLSKTHFYNLILENQGVKYGDIDVYVDGTLNLTDREFHMDTNTVWVLNPDTGAVKRTSGYVSSLQDGGLLRRTDTTLPYFFAVGSDTLTPRFRPVIFQPRASNINHYKVRFANFDPTAEGFSRAIKDPLVCQINPNWYHRFYHVTGTDSAAIAIMFDTVADGNWNDIVHWQNQPKWESIHKDLITPGTPFFAISKFIWNNYVYSPFALAITSDSFAVATNSGPYCTYDTISLFAQPGGMASYSWRGPDYFHDTVQNPTLPADTFAAGTYTVTITNQYGCVQAASTTVVVNVPPAPSASNGGPYCSYDSISLFSTPSGLTAYVWSGPNAYNSNVQNPVLQAANNGGSYTVTVTDHNNCTGSASTAVVVHVAPDVSASNTGPYCSYDTIYLTAAPGGDTYAWSGPNGYTSTSQTATQPGNTNSGTYTVTVTDANSCSGSASTAVVVNAAPVAVAGVDTILWKSDTIQLNGYGGISGVWSPGNNLSCTACYTPYAWPDSNTEYYLTVVSDQGCKNTDSIFVLARDKPLILFFIPNAITPNGDGYNDTWVIRDLDGFPQNEVRIINRWGDEVFYQSPYQNEWGGTWNGKDLPGGTYYYILRVFYEGQWVKFDGPLTVIR